MRPECIVPAITFNQPILTCLALHAAAAVTSEDGAKEAIAKVLPRLVLFGALPPSIVPVLLSIRKALDVQKHVDKKLLRLTYYLIQLACGDGSAGTTMPFSPLTGGAVGWQLTCAS